MRRGLVLGKFLPPHRGHQFLVTFAANHPSVDEVVVLACSLPDDELPGALRERWITETFASRPDVRVVGHRDVIPQHPDDDPEFWSLWRDAVATHVGRVDVVFASEAYGAELAATLDARSVPADPQRLSVPMSGTRIRTSLRRDVDLLVAPAHPAAVGRVVVAGAESTGKTSLVARLARHYAATSVPEYGRTWFETCLPGRRSGPDTVTVRVLEDIVAGQLAAEEAAASLPGPLLVCDTDAVTTLVWADAFLPAVPSPVERAARASVGRYDLTLVCDTDVPFVDAGSRTAGGRAFSTADLVAAYRRYGRDVTVLSGSYDARFEAACGLVDAWLDGPGDLSQLTARAATLELWPSASGVPPRTGTLTSTPAGDLR